MIIILKPETASDAAQSLAPAEFARLMQELNPAAQAVVRSI